MFCRGNENVRDNISLFVNCLTNGNFDGLSDLSENDIRDLQIFATQQKLRLLLSSVACSPDFLRWNQDVLHNDETLRQKTNEVVDCLSSQLKDKQVRAAIIKGLSFEGCIYGNEHLRDLGDIDILAKPEDVSMIHGVLLGLGYQQQLGPSSLAGLSSRARAAIYTSRSVVHPSISLSMSPLRKHFLKHEYAPYTKIGYPTVELHDGFCTLPDSFIESAIFSVFKPGCHLIKVPAINLIFLLETAYDNSESFFSNAFDYAVNLRDYIDLRNFFKQYREKFDWQKFTYILEKAELQDHTSIVLRNLDELFGGEGDYGCLSFIRRFPSIWDVGIEERAVDKDVAKRAAVGLFRNNLSKISRAVPLPPLYGDSSIFRNESDIEFSFISRDGSLFAVYQIPEIMLNNDHLYQICLYPLEGNFSVLSYKIDLGFYDGLLRAYGHATERLFQGGAIQKKTNCELIFNYSKYESCVTIELQLDALLDYYGIGPSLENFAVSFCACMREHGDIFRDASSGFTQVLEGVDLGRVGLLVKEGVCFSINFMQTCYTVYTNDDSLAMRFCHVFPQACSGWIIASDNKEFFSIKAIRGDDGLFSFMENGNLVASEMEVEEISYSIMQTISNRFCEHVNKDVFVAHAAALRINKSVVLLMGKSCAGKTSLAVAFSRFACLMGDECVLIDIKNGSARCENFPIQIKDVNTDIREYLGWPEGLAMRGGPHGGTHYYPRSCANADSSPEKDSVISCIVFPEYDPLVDKVIIDGIEHSCLVESILSSFQGDCSPALALKAFVHMVSDYDIDMVRLRYGNAAVAADVLYDYLTNRDKNKL